MSRSGHIGPVGIYKCQHPGCNEAFLTQEARWGHSVAHDDGEPEESEDG